MAVEQTLSIIKPDGVQKNLIGEIYGRFEKAGLEIVAARMVHLSDRAGAGFLRGAQGAPVFQRPRGLHDLRARRRAGAAGRRCDCEESRDHGCHQSGRRRSRARSAPILRPASRKTSCTVPTEPDTAATEIAFFFGDGGVCPRTR